MTPFVSVIIPNYNHQLYLNKRLDSVLNQTYQNFEIIILDDCSTDNSRNTIEYYRNNKKVTEIVYNDTNSGSTFIQWERGLSLAKGKLIWIAESDDYCENNFLQTLVCMMESEQNIGLTYCKSIRVDENEKYIDDLSFWYEEFKTKRWDSNFINSGINEINYFLYKKNTIPNASAVLFKKELIQFDLKELREFFLCGDWLFWIHLLEKTQIGYSSKELNFFRTHNQTVRSSNKAEIVGNEERKKVYNYLLQHKLISKSKYKMAKTLNQQSGKDCKSKNWLCFLPSKKEFIIPPIKSLIFTMIKKKK